MKRRASLIALATATAAGALTLTLATRAQTPDPAPAAAPVPVPATAAPTAAPITAPPTAPPTAPAKFPADEARLRATINALAEPKLLGRLVGSPGERDAAALVEKGFSEAGLTAPMATMTRPFPAPACLQAKPLGTGSMWGLRVRPGVACAGGESRNVLAEIRGAPGQEAILVGAHIDHLGAAADAQGKPLIFRGAEDNATGVAAMLEVARTLGAARKAPPKRTIYFVGFGGEEAGMLGSRAFVQTELPKLEPVRLMVNLDMVGLPVGSGQMYSLLLPPNAVGTVGTETRPALQSLVDAACRAHGLVALSGRNVPGIGDGIWKRTYGRGDGFSFEKARIPHVFFGDAEPSQYHTAADVPEKIDFPRLKARTEMIADLVWNAANQEEPLPAFTALPRPGR